jgi:hypothetical protein
MRDFVTNYIRPLFRRLIDAARESNQDSLVKKLDLIKDEYELDETNLLVIMSR